MDSRARVWFPRRRGTSFRAVPEATQPREHLRRLTADPTWQAQRRLRNGGVCARQIRQLRHPGGTKEYDGPAAISRHRALWI